MKLTSAVLAALIATPLLAQPLPPPAVTVDSTCTGYGTAVLTDGKWVVLGQEITQVYGHRDALGNCGNSWVSAPAEGEHWVRLDWPQAVTLNQISLWWTQPVWWPRAVRVEMLSDTNWVSLTGPSDWLRPTAQHGILTFPQVTARTIRLLQHPQGGEPDRGFLALQEITAQLQPDAKPGLEGVRKLTAEELKGLEPVKLERNIARITDSYGRWWPENIHDYHNAAGLNDGDLRRAVLLPKGAMPGIDLIIPHVIDGAAVFFAGVPPDANQVQLQVAGARERWLPVRTGLQAQRDGTRQGLIFTFEPLATGSLSLRLPPNSQPVTEIEVYRCVPAGPNVWPERLVNGQYERDLLASGEEPSFARLSTAALSMTPARALLGLKDDTREVGVTFDGDIITPFPLHLSFGEKRERIADYRDTIYRHLPENGRPEVTLLANLGGLQVGETARVAFMEPNRSTPGVLVDVDLYQWPAKHLDTAINVTIETRGKPIAVKNGIVTVGDQVVLVLPPGVVLEVDGSTVCMGAKSKGAFGTLFWQPLVPMKPDQVKWPDFLDSWKQFEGYWNETLAPAATIEVPERRVNSLVKAVLTQLFINADGDIMPYGSAPSVYDGNLYGVEEGFAMMALAQSGFAADAERYMDHTYLTPGFLVKVPEYKKYADRHQQYRNGLQPWYAVRLYRLTRNRAWIEKHLPLLRECAEWTIAQRRTTMVEENGQQPLHWGLLPKWSYGGDISELQCYALYANFCCWKGLADTAWLLDDLGDKATAARYRQEAADYRACIDRAVEGNALRDRTPPFLPLQLYARGPVGNDYDQLFIGCLLDLMALEPGGQQERLLTDWMEADNRTFCLLPRFRRDVGPGGLDGLYGLGYIQSKLQQDKVNEFLLGFYAYLAFNMDHTTFASRETNLLYASDLHVRSAYKVPDMSDPIPCSSAVALLLLRDMLAMEAPAKWGEPNTELRLLYGTPKAWFEQGKTIRYENLPTEFGPVSVTVEANKNAVTATIRPPTRNPWQRLVIRLRHPEGKPWQRVRVNGRPWTDADPARELVTLRPGPESFEVKVEY